MIGIKELLNNKSWASEEFKNMRIKCGRLLKRFILSMITLSVNPALSISAASANYAEAKAIYRMVDNPEITEEMIIATHKQATIKRIIESGEKIVLNVQDTTELNYTGLKKTSGLGEIGSNIDSRGLIVHSSLAVLTDGLPLGLLAQNVWARDPEERGKSKNDYKRAFEEKESYKWFTGMENGTNGMPDGIRVVNVCDREGDIFEFFAKAIENKREFLVRAVQNRKTDEDEKILEKVQGVDVSGIAIVDIPRDTRNNIKARKVALEIRHTKVNVAVPERLASKYRNQKYIELYIVHAKETTLPEEYTLLQKTGKNEIVESEEKKSSNEPIEWYLVTNIPVESFDDAMEKVRWYVHRWKIERFHYVLKSGCKIEELQQETSERIQKLIPIYSIIAARLLCITYLARTNPDIPCDIVLEEYEWQVLYCIANKTKKPPEKILTIKQAVLLLAKIGGFLGRKGDGEPGVVVIWRGYRELSSVLQYANYIPPRFC
jgi:hypothetical protein